MPTVVHIAEATFAGVGRHVLDLVEAQSERGIDVHVVAGSVRETSSFAAHRRRLTEVVWHQMELARSPARSDLAARRELTRLVSSLEPDVIHGHSSKGGLLARSIPAAGAAVVYTPHAPYAMNPSLPARTRWAATTMERALAHRTDAIIAVSPEEAAFLASLGVPQPKIFTVPNGIKTIEQADGHRVRKHLGLPAERPIVGFVGRLEPQKAPDHLVQIFEAVAKQHPSACFAVVGTGSQSSLVEQAARRAPLQGRLHAVGEQVGTWAMSAFDVLVLPSRYEGFPYVLLEAAQLGLPSVVSECATSSLLESGPATVWSVPLGHTEGFAERIRAVLNGRPRGTSATSQFGCDDRFTIERMATETAAVYQAICPQWAETPPRGAGTGFERAVPLGTRSASTA